MTELVPNLSALTHLEKLVFGADAKKDALGNIIEQGHGNLSARIKATEAAIKAAVPSIPVDTVVAHAAASVMATISQSTGVVTPPETMVAPLAVPAAVTDPAPVTPAPVAVAPITTIALAPGQVLTSLADGTPIAASLSVEAVQAAVPSASPELVAAVLMNAPVSETHASLVAKLKAFLGEAEAKIEEIL